MKASRQRRSFVRPLLGMALCALVAVVGGGAPVAGGATTPPPSRDYFGMNAQWVFKLPEAEWDGQLAAIARTGVGEVRRDAFWSQVEPSAPLLGHHRYVWTRPDAVIAALARNGLRWYPILDYATTWSGTVAGPERWKSAPSNPADFAAYAAAFARRYGAGGSFWAEHPALPALPVDSYEIWNEPNLSDFWPNVQGAADRYAQLLAATVPALRVADPQGRVVVGGLSPTGLLAFLDRVEARRPGLIALTDAVAFHPYGTTFANTGARVRELRDWLDAHGAALLPIDITETGWATPPLPEDARAIRMSALVPGLVRSSCGISRFIPQTWITPDVDVDDPNDFFGVANADATLKPTGAALVDAIADLERGSAAAPSDPCLGRSVAAQPPGESGGSPGTPPPSPSPPPAAPGPSPSAPSLGALLAAPARPPAATTVPPGVPAPRRRARRRASVTAAVSRHGRRVVVVVRCTRACRAVVRVRRAGGRRLGARRSARFTRRYRATVRLHGRRHGMLTVRVRAKIRGARALALVRRVR